jgi:hypothetical protein
MRLPKVERDHRLSKKLILGLIRLVGGRRAPDVVRMIFYRPEILGAQLAALCQASLRGPSEWTVGERELFAAFVSRQNQCVF